MNPTKPAAEAFLLACKQRRMRVATAESCTGGMIISLMTDPPGSSSVVDRGFVTYSNDAKIDMLGVSPETLHTHGAVSRETALEMARGALKHSRADIAISVTGIAGPDGGSEAKPVGLVWFGVATTGRAPVAERRMFEDKGREFVRRQAAETALRIALDVLEAGQAGLGFP